MAKAQWRIIPLVLVAYIMAWMDRINVSFAALQMNADLGFSATVYGAGSSLFFLSYGFLEVPSAALAARYGPRRWLARIMVTWGLIAAAMALVRTPMQFYAMRFLLGAAEAGFFPCLVYYFAQWFPMAWRGRAISRIYIAGGLAPVVMGLVSPPLLALDGLLGWRGWQWLFIAEGLPAVLMGLVLLRWLPDTPDSVDWLNSDEKGWIAAEMAADARLIGEAQSHNMLAALTNPMVLLLGLIGMLGNLSGSGITFFAPAILKARTGLDTTTIGQIVSLGGAGLTLCILVAGWLSDRSGDRLRVAYGWALLVTTGIMLLTYGTGTASALAGYLLFAWGGYAAGCVVVASWPDVIPLRQLAVASAAINTLWQVGFLLAPYLFGMARDATGSFHAGLVGALAVSLCYVATIALVRRHVLAARTARLAELGQ